MSLLSEITAGTTLGPFVLESAVAHPGAGTAFASRHADGRPCLIRVRRSGSPEDAQRFLNAAAVACVTRVSGVASVHDAGLHNGWLWFAMDRVAGRPFCEPPGSKSDLDQRIALAITRGAKLCRTLAGLHDAGVGHLGLCPQRARVDEEGDVHVVEPLVGAAFDAGPLGETPLMAYRAPESLGGVPEDHRQDLFTVGLMIHEAIAGPRADEGADSEDWRGRTCLERLPELATKFPEVSRGLSDLVSRLCAVDPDQRPTARDAWTELQKIELGAPSCEWPTAPFVDPGAWWAPLRGCLGESGSPAAWVLEGATGSGRRRIAEQLHRLGLLQGRWTIHLRCEVSEVGGPLRQLFETLVGALDRATMAEAASESAALLAQLWPHIPFPKAPPPGHPGSRTRVREAVAQVLTRVAQEQPILVVVHRLERIDPQTQRALVRLVDATSPRLGLLALHEHRWSTPASRQAVHSLKHSGAGVLAVPPMEPSTANTLAAALCPGEPPVFRRASTPYAVLESSYRALATWRGESFTPPEGTVWPLTVLEAPIPRSVFDACVGAKAAESPWVQHDERAVSLSGPTARRLALPRLTNLKRTAAALATAWEKVLAQLYQPAMGDLASLWLLAGELVRAWPPAAQCAIDDLRKDCFATARRWIELLDTLEQPTSRDQDLQFDLAYSRARIALYTEDGAEHPELMEIAESRARTDPHRSRARLLRAEIAYRRSEPRAALVKALRAGSPNSGAPIGVQLQALVLALRSRLDLGEDAEVERELQRADGLLESSYAAPSDDPWDGHPLDGVRLADVRAQLALQRQDLTWCRALCQEHLRAARRLRHPWGIARACSRLAEVLRQLGRRTDAEQQIRAACDAAQQTGDPRLEGDVHVRYATLLAEHGDTRSAWHLIDELAGKVEALSLRHLRPGLARLTLQLATLLRDSDRAAAAIKAHQRLGQLPSDPEWPAVLVRWLRTSGRSEEAIAIVGPAQERSFAGALFAVERARAAEVAGDRTQVHHDARRAVELATQLGFEDLGTYAGLLLGACSEVDDDAWAELQRKAAQSQFVEVYLGALALDARRDRSPTPRWKMLLARARELGYLPGIEEAQNWLSSS